MLLLQEQIVSANYFSAANPDNRFGDNFIVLDPQHGTWRGRLFIEELGDIRQGVYDELSGSYRGFAPVPEPSPLLLTLLAIGGINILRTRQTV